MIFVIKLRLYKGRRSPSIIWLCLLFSSICFSFWENFPANHLKALIGVTKAVSSLFAILCFLPLSKIWYYVFFSTGTRKGTNVFNVSANLRKFYWTKRDKSYSKDLYFLCRKTLRNGIELLLRSVSNHA